MERKMKFTLWMLMVLMLVSVGCKKKEAIAGKASVEEMLTMLPENPALVLSFDFHKFAAMDLFDKMISKKSEPAGEEKKIFKDYPDFVAKTGIDLKKDLFYITFALYGNMAAGSEPEGVGVVNLKYDPNKILGLLKQNQMTLSQETYNGITVYSVKDPEQKLVKSGKDFRFAFLNPSNIALGTPNQVKMAIDLSKGKGTSARKSKALGACLERIDQQAMFWLALTALPESVKSQPKAGGMFPVDLSKAESFLGFIDYRDKMLSVEFQLISRNEPGNKQLADTLNGFKAIGAMGLGKDPKNAELGELLNSIAITASADSLKLKLAISEQLMNKLGEKAKSTAEGYMKKPAAEAGEPMAPAGPQK
jgi:hypothetical protein